MNLHDHHLTRRLRRRALSSPCRTKIAAVGVNHRGQVIAIANNLPREYRYGGGLHAEQLIIHRSPRNLSKIIIARVGGGGHFLPVHPCGKCVRMAAKYGIEIESLRR